MQEKTAKINEHDMSQFMDFGMGKAQIIDPFYLANGIIV